MEYKDRRIKYLSTNIIDTYKIVYSKFTEYTLFSNKSGVFIKIDIYSYKAILKNFKEQRLHNGCLFSFFYMCPEVLLIP